MYVDEVGNNDLKASADPNHRFLSLTGVLLELEYVRAEVQPALETLKQTYFDSHPDEPVILHRKELVNAKYPFLALRDPFIQQSFNARLLRLLSEIDYTVITVVIDKLEVVQRYAAWKVDPYQYCLEALVEQFVLWLDERRAVGDVMAESRGGREDIRLKAAFTHVCKEGTGFLGSELFAACLSSHELKVKPKAVNIAGLQIADLIAHPSFVAARCRKSGIELPANFGGLVAGILEESKYARSEDGMIDGWGRRWLP